MGTMSQDKLTPITGILPQHQTLSLFPSTDDHQRIAILSDGGRTLAEYGVKEWNCIKVSLVFVRIVLRWRGSDLE